MQFQVQIKLNGSYVSPTQCVSGVLTLSPPRPFAETANSQKQELQLEILQSAVFKVTF